MPTARLTALPLPKNLDPARYERAIENFLDAGAENLRIDFEVTTQTWKEQPEFEIVKEDGAREVKTENLIYKFVSGGTRVRYAVMTPNFVAKTVPDRIKSRKGRGGVAFISRNHPRPGITPRNFPQAIIKKWSRRWLKLYRQMQQDEILR